MGPEFLTYPFLFVALFFESFLLVTFLSRPAREARARAVARIDDPGLPKVAIIVPCLNEGATIAGTVESLLSLEYPGDKLELVLVDNGSDDDTPTIMARYAGHPQVTVLCEERRGKHNAVNAGVAATDAELVGCLDADSLVTPDALRRMVLCFKEADVAAVVAAILVHEPQTTIEYMQSAEYVLGVNIRHTLSSLNGLFVTPGAFSLYRRATLDSVGGFRHGHQTEDLEIALRLQMAGHRIENSPEARVYTKAPATLRALFAQRVRWMSGLLRNVLGEYRSMLFSPRQGTVGMLILPLVLFSFGSAILMFGSRAFILGEHLFHTYATREGVPLSYAYLPHTPTFDWFYLPGNAFVLLVFVILATSLALIILGKKVSRAPVRLTRGILSYLILYGLIAPLWLVKAAVDVVLGRKISWR
jgi:biofilm PGA synthesis N-glycosyltransferase PgaC